MSEIETHNIAMRQLLKAANNLGKCQSCEKDLQASKVVHALRNHLEFGELYALQLTSAIHEFLYS